MTSKYITAFNIYTHEILFQLKIKTKPWNRMLILSNNFLLFEDATANINVYDIRAKDLRAKTSTIATYPLTKRRPGDSFNTNTAWCQVGDNLLIQMPDALRIFENPYTNAVVEANDFLVSPFTETEGLFIPVISGGINISATSFDKFYSRALVERNLEILKTPIYPFFVNALHYFAIAANADGIAYCI